MRGYLEKAHEKRYFVDEECRENLRSSMLASANEDNPSWKLYRSTPHGNTNHV